MALLAAVGCDQPAVFARPRVAIAGTGDELVDVSEKPGRTQIRDTNRVSLAAQVERCGGVPVPLPIVRDNREAVRAAFEEALGQADLLLFSGGVSAGQYDYVKDVFEQMGGQVIIDRVAIRPGAPLVFGKLYGKPFFGLPGNPLSTMVTFELFLRPALELLGGAHRGPPRLLSARLAHPFEHKPAGLTALLPAVLEEIDGQTAVRALPWQGSGDLTAMARADVLLVVPPHTARLEAGAFVSILPK
jgi:molybdopterin molybdotransferase